jgi:hypothetical protein
MELRISLHVLGLDSEYLDRAFDIGKIQALRDNRVWYLSAI